MPKTIEKLNPTISAHRTVYAKMEPELRELHIREGGAFRAFNNEVVYLLSRVIPCAVSRTSVVTSHQVSLACEVRTTAYFGPLITYTIHEQELREWLKGEDRTIISKAMSVATKFLRFNIDPEGLI